MYYPTFEEFYKKADEGNLIPVYREVLADMDTPVSAYSRLRSSAYSFLFESIEGGEKWARYSFLGVDPIMVITSENGTTKIIGTNAETIQAGDPLNVVQKIMDRYHVVADPALPRFFGGAVGFLSYDMIRYFENMSMQKKDSLGLPDMLFMVMDTILVFDNITHKIKVVSNAFLEDKTTARDAYDKAVRKIDNIITRLQAPLQHQKTDTEHGPHIPVESPSAEKTDNRHSANTGVASNITQEQFEKSVVRAKEYIAAGDAFQIVLSQRFEKRIKSDPFDIYRALRTVNPSPYMYFFQLDNICMLGSSPEILVRAEGDKVTVKPIAGTRKRGSDEKEDLILAKDLKADQKEVAEHIMLVDLGRNDIGRVSKVGSIIVEDMLDIEKYSHVIHMTTQVTGKIEEGKNCYDIMRACFPAGTVSGAPKIRAMEIIDQLETTGRGPYAGAVGYFSYNNNVDTCINIRGIIVKDNIAYIQAGAGIVADSVPYNEFIETQNKGMALMKAISIAEAGLGWEPAETKE